MRSATCVGLIIALACACLGLCSCGNPSAKEVAQGFAKAMVMGDLQGAAEHWDYITYARKENSDWDNIASSQRNLIIKKLAEDRAKELQYWRGYFPRGTKVTDVNERDDKAIAQLAGGRAEQINLIKIDDKWYVEKIE